MFKSEKSQKNYSKFLYFTLITSIMTYFPSLRGNIGYLIVYITFALLVIIFLKSKIYQKDVINNFENNFIYLYLYCGYITIVLINIVQYQLPLSTVFRQVGYIIGFIISFYFLPPLIHNNINKFRDFLINIGVFLSIITIIDFFLNGILNVFGFSTYRYYITSFGVLPGFRSLTHNVNNFGIMIMFSLFASFVKWFNHNAKINSTDFVRTLFLLIILLFSWARSAYLGVFVMLFIYILFYYKDKYYKHNFFKFFVILFMVSIFSFLFAQYFLRIDFFAIPNEVFLRLEEGTGRFNINRVSLKAYFINPIIGYGPQKNILMRYIGYEGASGHNSYLSILLQSGIVGFIFYISIFLLTIYKGIKYLMYDSKWLVCMIIGFMFQSFFEASTIGGISYISLLVTFILGLINYFRFIKE